jgi:hypothetical protein
MTDERRPKAEQRATVDITVDPETMLQVRDEYRARLIRQYHLLRIASRANRKVGNHELAHKQDGQAERTAIMIWCMDNPMAVLTPRIPRSRGTDDQSA